MRFAGEDEEYLRALFAPETLEKKPWDGPDHIVINKLERDSKGVVVVESYSPFQDRFLKLPYEKRLDGSSGIVAYQFCATLQARNSLRVLQRHGRLATADLRLSVFLNTAASGGSSGVSATAGTCGVVHGGARAELAPAAAQRIVAIAGDGDQGLIALAACQSYVKEIVSTK
jgi:hypothetical protein